MNFAVDDVQIGPANAAGCELEQQVAAMRLRRLALHLAQRLARTVELHGPERH
jgi:hypothetical protein